MTDDPSFEALSLEHLSMDQLVELSSFGSDKARHDRALTPPSVKKQLLASLLGRPADDGSVDAPVVASRMATPYFFMSYSREADQQGRGQDPDVHRLFQLLCLRMTELAPDIDLDEATPAASMIPGYLGDPLVGRHPRLRLLRALSSCRVFVPLLSPGYVRDRWCLHEWDTFRRRDDRRRRRHPFDFSAIVPVLWTPIGESDVPEWVKDVPIVDATLGSEYAERGLRALKIENPPAYQKAVFRLARRIHDMAECLTVSTEDHAS